MSASQRSEKQKCIAGGSHSSRTSLSMCARQSASKSTTYKRSPTIVLAMHQAPSEYPTSTPMMRWRSTIRSKSARISSPLHSCLPSNPQRPYLKRSKRRHRFRKHSKPPNTLLNLHSCRRSNSKRRSLQLHKSYSKQHLDSHSH